MTEKNAEKTISYKTAKGKTISLSPQEYEEIKGRIEISGERLLFRHSGGKAFGGIL